MRSPTYAEDFVPDPRPERVVAMSHLLAVPYEDRPVLSMGIKTITHTRDGLKLHPHETVVVEIREGSSIASFDISPSTARHYARRLIEFANRIETKKAS